MPETSSTYILEFQIDYLPKMANQLLRGHWRTAYAHAKKVKRSVWRNCWHLKPAQPLPRARLTLIRHSSVEPDFDGLVSSFKHVIDGLVETGILAGDKMSNIDPHYKWLKAGRGRGKISVLVEEIK